MLNPSPMYPRLYLRIQAAIIDTVILIVIFFSAVLLLADLSIWGGYKGLIIALLFLTIEPVMVSMTGGTIGHHLLGLRIQGKSNQGNLNLISAILRFLTKSTVGLFSFIFMMVTTKHQALHDLASNSVVVFKNPQNTEVNIALAEQTIYSDQYNYPIWYRRILVILMYKVALFFMASTILLLMLSENCIEYDRCNSSEIFFEGVLSLLILAGFALILVLGWKGKLYGAKRQLKHTV